MREFLQKLLLFAVFWGIFFLAFNHRAAFVPTARAWISHPLVELQNTLDQKLSREQRYHFSYLFPKIYPISYVCSQLTDDLHPMRPFLPGESFESPGLKKRIQIKCGDQFSMFFYEPAKIALRRGLANNPAVEVQKGGFYWIAGSFSLVFSYMTVEITTKGGGKAEFSQIDPLTFLLTPDEKNEFNVIDVKRNLLPNFWSPRLQIQSGHPVILKDFGKQLTTAPNEQLLLAASYIRQIKSEGKHQ